LSFAHIYFLMSSCRRYLYRLRTLHPESHDFVGSRRLRDNDANRSVRFWRQGSNTALTVANTASRESRILLSSLEGTAELLCCLNWTCLIYVKYYNTLNYINAESVLTLNFCSIGLTNDTVIRSKGCNILRWYFKHILLLYLQILLHGTTR
jgi:hypothetical protein